jgi:hypothetical protein
MLIQLHPKQPKLRRQIHPIKVQPKNRFNNNIPPPCFLFHAMTDGIKYNKSPIIINIHFPMRK